MKLNFPEHAGIYTQKRKRYKLGQVEKFRKCTLLIEF